MCPETCTGLNFANGLSLFLRSSLTSLQLCRTRRQTTKAPALQPKPMLSSASEIFCPIDGFEESAPETLYMEDTHTLGKLHFCGTDSTRRGT